MKREIVLATLDLTSTPSASESTYAIRHAIEVKCFYDAGGFNIASYLSEDRGIYVSVAPYEYSRGFKSTIGGTGIKSFVKALNRFSQKSLSAARPSRQLVSSMVDKVLYQSKVELTEEGKGELENLLLSLPSCEEEVV
jgi:hypothetical protein